MKIPIYLIISILSLTFVFAQEKPVRIGIAGMTHDHVNQILHNPNRQGIEIVGFSEPNKELAMRLLKKNNLPESLWYASLAEMIAKTKPDAVCAFGNIFDHLKVVETSAPKGIHVMVEKPLAVNMAHAMKIEALAKKYKINVLTNYETTWYPSDYEAIKRIEQGEIGEIRKVVIRDGHRGPREIGVSNEFFSWLTDPVLNGGGAIIDFGCYGADLMTWLMKGEKPLTVTAITQQIKPDIYPKVDDDATIIVTYPHAEAVIQASWNWPFDRKDMEIYGKTGYIFADKTLEMKMRKGDRNAPKEESVAVPPLQSPMNDPFSYLAAVVRGKLKSEDDLSSLKVNMTAMKILDAAVKSSKSGRTIKLQ